MSLFSLAAIEGAIELARYRAEYPGVELDDAIRYLRSGPSDAAHLDYDLGRLLVHEFGEDLLRSAASTRSDRRRIIRRIVTIEEPLWRLAVPKGLQWCRAGMDADTAQCLGWADLWKDPPDDEAVEWWDELAAAARGRADLMKLARGRNAERLTLEYERARLRGIGVLDREPRWRSLEDNTLGYDIESWDRQNDGSLGQIRIEVKGYAGGAGRFFLTRREWEIAQRFAEAYRFDIWDLDRGELLSRSVRDLEPSTPVERVAGRWDTLILDCQLLFSHNTRPGQ